MPSSPITVIARSPAKRGDAAISQPIERLLRPFAGNGARNDKKYNLPPLVVIAGPTASGKTDMAISLAKEFGGEIVSADSRQVYRGMDVATAKPPRDLRFQISDLRLLNSPALVDDIPHHLIDVVDPDEPFTLADYKRLAIERIKEIHGRGKTPFLVGGTGLYIWAVVDNLEIPKVPPDARLRDSLESKMTDELLKILREFDPDAPLWIQTTNKRRLIRAIEVYMATREPFSRQRKKGPPLFRTLMLGIDLPREELYRRIDARVDWQVKHGLIEETQGLLQHKQPSPAFAPQSRTKSPSPSRERGGVRESARRDGPPFYPPLIKGGKQEGGSHGYDSSLPSMSGIGYREIIAYLQGRSTLQEAVQKIKYRTHGYARRQGTWFRKEKRIVWVRTVGEAQILIRQFLGSDADRGG